MRRTQSDHRERICSHSGQLIKLSTFIDTPTLTGESKGQGRLVGEPAITGSTWHLSDDKFTCAEDDCKTVGRFMPGLVTVCRPGSSARGPVAAACYSPFTIGYIDDIIITSQSLDQQLHKTAVQSSQETVNHLC